MMKRILAAGFALWFGGTAYAADVPVPYKASPPAQVFTWTGCYVAGNGGGGRAHDDWQPVAGTTLAPVRASGWCAGVQGGCDYQVSSFVFGVEGQFDWADMHGIALVIPPGGGTGLQLSSSLDRFATATGRIGYAFDRVLLYAKGGAAFAHYNHGMATDNFAAPPVPTLAGGQSVTGFVAGGGVEVALLPNWSFKAEYNYFDFGTNSVRLDCVPAACGTTTAGITLDIHQQVQTFMLGVNYRFGDFGPIVAKY